MAPVVLGCIRHGSVLYGVVLRGKSRFGRRVVARSGELRIGVVRCDMAGEARCGEFCLGAVNCVEARSVEVRQASYV